jgi:hypothetical protein
VLPPVAATSVVLSTLALVTMLSLGATRAAGQVPTVADFAACNDEAPKILKAGTTSPTPGDHARAERARLDAATARTSTSVESLDPQIHGMSAAGANDAGYQAAYRSCMRRKGF